MAYVLAEHPVKHPNYPNGDHYAVVNLSENNMLIVSENDVVRLKDEDIASSYSPKEFNNSTERPMKLLYKFDSKYCVAEFLNTHSLCICTYANFIKGRCRDYLEPSICGVGIVGFPDVNIINPVEYNVWRGMIKRVYGSCANVCYTKCNVDNSFYFFPNFLDWYNNQSNLSDLKFICSLLPNLRIELDKDILRKGNKTYSKLNCTLIPSSLNKLFTGYRNNNYPTGLTVRTNGYDRSIRVTVRNMFDVAFTMGKSFKQANDSEDVEYYRNIAKAYSSINLIPEEQWAAIGFCFLQYKKHKESYIKYSAKYWYNYEYEGKIYHCITKECYDALMNWEVDIND